MKYKDLVVATIYTTLKNKGLTSFSQEEIARTLEVPPQQQMGDYAFPCYLLAKELKRAPQQIAKELSTEVSDKWIERVEAVGPYINFFFAKQVVGGDVATTILEQREKYGRLNIGKGENITIDLSSPNIAKPFSMGHLRSTVIGNALANIMEKCGFNPIKINHLGDWGTQFGKLITAYKLWGNEAKVKAEPIKELLALYIRFHEEAEENPELEQEGRLWFKKLEDGDKEAHYLWNWFREESLLEFARIYELMGIDFHSFNGEAFYNDKMDAVVKELEEKNLLSESKGAMVVSLEEYDEPPCLIKKSDGATLYATRDLAAALYRKKEYQFAKSLYVVGREQALHFSQLFHVLQKMGYEWAHNLHHIPFGMILKEGKKMSTRKGKTVLLEDVLKEAILLAKKNIEERNQNLENQEEVAKDVGVGAVIFHDLKNDRLHDIEFSLETMLTFEGETGPYVQYTHARACSILRKAGNVPSVAHSYESFEDEKAWAILSLLMKFEEVIKQSYAQFDPSQIAKYCIDLAQAFNKYYGAVRIVGEDAHIGARLQLVASTKIVLKEGLGLLGLKAPEQM